MLYSRYPLFFLCDSRGILSRDGVILYLWGVQEVGCQKWGHIWLFNFDITVGKVGTIVLTNIAIAGTWKVANVTDGIGGVLGYIAEVMTVRSKYLDGVRIVGVCRFRLQGSDKLTEVAVDSFSVENAGNVELDIPTNRLVFRPYAYIVSFVLDAEVSELLDWRIRITTANRCLYFWFFNRVTVVIKQVEVIGLLGLD